MLLESMESLERVKGRFILEINLAVHETMNNMRFRINDSQEISAQILQFSFIFPLSVVFNLTKR